MGGASSPRVLVTWMSREYDMDILGAASAIGSSNVCRLDVSFRRTMPRGMADASEPPSYLEISREQKNASRGGCYERAPECQYRCLVSEKTPRGVAAVSEPPSANIDVA